MNRKSKVMTISIRLPEELKAQMDEVSEKEHWNFNQSVIEAIKRLVKNQEKL